MNQLVSWNIIACEIVLRYLLGVQLYLLSFDVGNDPTWILVIPRRKPGLSKTISHALWVPRVESRSSEILRFWLFRGSLNRWEVLQHIITQLARTIKVVYTASWVIIYHRSHLLREPETAIDWTFLGCFLFVGWWVMLVIQVYTICWILWWSNKRLTFGGVPQLSLHTCRKEVLLKWVHVTLAKDDDTHQMFWDVLGTFFLKEAKAYCWGQNG